jgi:hypothetical protein
MDSITKQEAELLANSFMELDHPLRTASWEFERGSEVVIVTVSIVKQERPEYKVKTAVAWSIPQYEESLS